MTFSELLDDYLKASAVGDRELAHTNLCNAIRLCPHPLLLDTLQSKRIALELTMKKGFNGWLARNFTPR